MTRSRVAPGESPETLVFADIEVDDFDALPEQLTPYSEKCIKLSPGPFRGRWTSAQQANGALIAKYTLNCGLYNHVECPEDWYGLCVALGSPGCVANGVALDRHQVVMTAPGSELEFDIRAEGGDFLVLSAERRVLDAVVGEGVSLLSMPRGTTPVMRAPSTVRELLGSVLSLLRLGEHAPEGLPVSLATNLLAGTLGTLDFELGLDVDPGGKRCSPSYATFAKSREVLAGMAEFDCAELAAAVNRCPRAIQMAFCEYARTTPYRYFRNLQLHRAREELLAGPSDRAETIGDIAAAHGFWNWSRFSQLYREQFGEAPSQTRVRSKSRPS